MNYLDLPKPHGWLLWRGKQKAIASDKPLSADPLLVISDGEAYGQATLSQPSAVNIAEFERLEDEHCIRREERKLYWPDSDVLYIHRLKDWQPFEAAKMVRLDNGSAKIIEPYPLTPEQVELIRQAERLPKTLVLLDEAVTLCDGKAMYCKGVDGSKVEPILKVTLDGLKSADDLPLYQLALVRIPRLSFKEKKSNTSIEEGGKAMPYKKVKKGDAWCVINEDTEEEQKCYNGADAEDKADALLASLRINVEADEEKSIKDLIAEARKCYYDGMAMPVIVSGPTTFADLQALEEAREQARETEELTWQFQMLSSNILSSPEIDDKAAALAALANEYGGLVNEAIKSATVEEDAKTEEVETEAKVGKRVKKSMKDKIREAWDTLKEFLDWAEPEEGPEMLAVFGKASEASHFGIKEVNGKPWFITYSTNAFEDREGEIFSTKSLELYVAEAEKKADRGYFNFWHIPGSDFAKKEWQAVPGKFLIEAGPFLDNELGQAALKFFKEYPDGHPEIAPEGWGCSPEYRYLPEERKSGVYENIWITRTSALPRLAAANVYTKGTIMAVTEQQEKAGKALFGDDLYTKLVKPAEDTTKELVGAGVANKEVTTETVTETTTETVEVDEQALVEKVAAQIGVDFQPIAEALTKIAETQDKFQTSLEEMAGRIKSLEKTEDVKTNAETPRYMVSVMNRASQAEKTIVTDDDKLKDQKPVETQVPVQSGAAAFFPAK